MSTPSARARLPQTPSGSAVPLRRLASQPLLSTLTHQHRQLDTAAVASPRPSGLGGHGQSSKQGDCLNAPAAAVHSTDSWLSLQQLLDADGNVMDRGISFKTLTSVTRQSSGNTASTSGRAGNNVLPLLSTRFSKPVFPHPSVGDEESDRFFSQEFAVGLGAVHRGPGSMFEPTIVVSRGSAMAIAAPISWPGAATPDGLLGHFMRQQPAGGGPTWGLLRQRGQQTAPVSEQLPTTTRPQQEELGQQVEHVKDSMPTPQLGALPRDSGDAHVATAKLHPWVQQQPAAFYREQQLWSTAGVQPLPSQQPPQLTAVWTPSTRRLTQMLRQASSSEQLVSLQQKYGHLFDIVHVCTCWDRFAHLSREGTARGNPQHTNRLAPQHHATFLSALTSHLLGPDHPAIGSSAHNKAAVTTSSDMSMQSPHAQQQAPSRQPLFASLLDPSCVGHDKHDKSNSNDSTSRHSCSAALGSGGTASRVGSSTHSAGRSTDGNVFSCSAGNSDGSRAGRGHLGLLGSASAEHVRCVLWACARLGHRDHHLLMALQLHLVDMLDRAPAVVISRSLETFHKLNFKPDHLLQAVIKAVVCCSTSDGGLGSAGDTSMRHMSPSGGNNSTSSTDGTASASVEWRSNGAAASAATAHDDFPCEAAPGCTPTLEHLRSGAYHSAAAAKHYSSSTATTDTAAGAVRSSTPCSAPQLGRSARSVSSSTPAVPLPTGCSAGAPSQASTGYGFERSLQQTSMLDGLPPTDVNRLIAALARYARLIHPHHGMHSPCGDVAEAFAAHLVRPDTVVQLSPGEAAQALESLSRLLVVGEEGRDGPLPRLTGPPRPPLVPVLVQRARALRLAAARAVTARAQRHRQRQRNRLKQRALPVPEEYEPRGLHSPHAVRASKWPALPVLPVSMVPAASMVLLKVLAARASELAACEITTALVAITRWRLSPPPEIMRALEDAVIQIIHSTTDVPPFVPPAPQRRLPAVPPRAAPCGAAPSSVQVRGDGGRPAASSVQGHDEDMPQPAPAPASIALAAAGTSAAPAAALTHPLAHLLASLRGSTTLLTRPQPRPTQLVQPDLLQLLPTTGVAGAPSCALHRPSPAAAGTSQANLPTMPWSTPMLPGSSTPPHLTNLTGRQQHLRLLPGWHEELTLQSRVTASPASPAAAPAMPPVPPSPACAIAEEQQKAEAASSRAQLEMSLLPPLQPTAEELLRGTTQQLQQQLCPAQLPSPRRLRGDTPALRPRPGAFRGEELVAALTAFASSQHRMRQGTMAVLTSALTQTLLTCRVESLSLLTHAYVRLNYSTQALLMRAAQRWRPLLAEGSLSNADLYRMAHAVIKMWSNRRRPTTQVQRRLSRFWVAVQANVLRNMSHQDADRRVGEELKPEHLVALLLATARLQHVGYPSPLTREVVTKACIQLRGSVHKLTAAWTGNLAQALGELHVVDPGLLRTLRDKAMTLLQQPPANNYLGRTAACWVAWLHVRAGDMDTALLDAACFAVQQAAFRWHAGKPVFSATSVKPRVLGPLLWACAAAHHAAPGTMHTLGRIAAWQIMERRVGLFGLLQILWSFASMRAYHQELLSSASRWLERRAGSIKTERDIHVLVACFRRLGYQAPALDPLHLSRLLPPQAGPLLLTLQDQVETLRMQRAQRDKARAALLRFASLKRRRRFWQKERLSRLGVPLKGGPA